MTGKNQRKLNGLLTPDTRIYVAGHRGMVGSAIVRHLIGMGCSKIITRVHAELDLCNQQGVRRFFQEEKIEYVVLAAAKVGGIHANDTYRGQFLYENLMIEANVIHEAFQAGIQRLLFLGSSCIYPKLAPQPMEERQLLTGSLEETNEPYAIAKIAGIKLCESYNRQYGTRYRCVMPTNLYGPDDNYDLMNSHVLPAMIRKFHLGKLAEAQNMTAIKEDERIRGALPADFKERLQKIAADAGSSGKIVLWGSGSPKREFLHVDDLASACTFLANLSDPAFDQVCTDPGNAAPVSHINIGTGEDRTIRELAEIVKDVVGFQGGVRWDAAKPDGTPRKLLDISRIKNAGWVPRISLREGIRDTYHCYQDENARRNY